MLINLLSKYRTELMGFSMLMVMIFHTIGGIHVPGISFKPFICFDFGVEFFIVLSAIGCTYSLERNSDTASFYKRRLKRILPAFLIVVTLDFIVYDIVLSDNISPLSFFRKLFFVSFLDGDISFWFILYIMACYLLTPYIYKGRGSIVLMCLIGVITLVLFAYGFNNNRNQNVLMYRLPIYFITLVCMNYARKQQLRLNFIILGTFTMIVYASLILFIQYPYKYLLYMIAAIPCVIFVAMVIDKIKSQRIHMILSFIGGISLELYLIHEKMLFLSDMISTNIIFRIIFSFALAITLSYLLHNSLSKIKFLSLRSY